MRLGFAVAINVDPDVLLVDEVLAVGDETFTHKCLDKFAEFRRRGKTVLLVTHSLDMVTRFCDEALWLDAGMVRAQGDPQRVIDDYRLDVAAAEDSGVCHAPPEAPQPGKPQTPQRSPPTCRERSKAAGARARSKSSASTSSAPPGAAHVFASGDPVEIRLRVRALSRSPTSCSASASSTPTVSAATAPTRTSKGRLPAQLDGDGEVVFAIAHAATGRRQLQARRRGAPRRTARPTTTIACCTRSVSPRRSGKRASSGRRTSGASPAASR